MSMKSQFIVMKDWEKKNTNRVQIEIILRVSLQMLIVENVVQVLSKIKMADIIQIEIIEP